MMTELDTDLRSQIHMILSKMDKIDILTSKVNKLDGKIDHMESVLSNLDGVDLAQDDICAKLSRSVTAIAGLQEAVSSKIRAVRILWSCILIIGISATVFYVYKTADQYLQHRKASYVRIAQNVSYKYPPILLCPDAWLDLSKIQAFGLSSDALKYSLSYFDDFHYFQIENVASARHEFVQFYNSSNYTSLIDYYKSISEDLVKMNTSDEYAMSSSSAYHCGGSCDDEKVFLADTGVCTAISMANAHGAVVSLSLSTIYAKVKIDDGWDKQYSAWYLYYPRLGVVNMYTKNFLLLSAYKYTFIKVSAMKFIRLPASGPDGCVSTEDDPSYMPNICVAKCQSELWKAKFNCVIWLKTTNMNRPLGDFCNLQDPFENTTFLTYIHSPELREYNDEVSYTCTERCPEKCERTVFDITVLNECDLSDADYDHLIHMMYGQNMSYIVINVAHRAVNDGGIMTYADVDTYSSVELINNVGGTLGLFIGGTVMTLIQLVVFVVEMIFERCRRQVVK